MEECTKGWDWIPSSIEDVTRWQSHLNCSSHLASILKFEGTNAEVVLEILKSGSLGTYRPWEIPFWEIPNLDQSGLEWMDQESLKWPLRASFYYWVERYSRFNSEGLRLVTDTNDEPAFSSTIISQDLEPDESYKETFKIAIAFAQHLWCDLWKQGTIHFRYYEDSVDGDTFRPDMPLHEFDLAEDYVNVFSDGSFTSWISYETVIDVLYGTGYVSERIASEGFRWSEEVDDTSLCMALVSGQESNDLEIKGDLASYFDQSGLFGQTDREYPVTVESEPDWTGKNYRDLSPDEQMHLAKSLINSSSHPLLTLYPGFINHLLICITLHSSTSDQLRAWMMAHWSSPELEAAVSYVGEMKSVQ
jgi:hypothetical protein